VSRKGPGPEDAFREAVEELAQLRGWRVHHVRAALKKDGSWYSPVTGNPGFPDNAFARDGVVLVVEFKTDDRYPSAQQRGWLDAIHPHWSASKGDRPPLRPPKARLAAYVWRPRDWKFIEEVLK